MTLQMGGAGVGVPGHGTSADSDSAADTVQVVGQQQTVVGDPAPAPKGDQDYVLGGDDFDLGPQTAYEATVENLAWIEEQSGGIQIGDAVPTDDPFQTQTPSYEVSSDGVVYGGLESGAPGAGPAQTGPPMAGGPQQLSSGTVYQGGGGADAQEGAYYTAPGDAGLSPELQAQIAQGSSASSGGSVLVPGGSSQLKPP